jgi:hypothetical protein
MPPTTIDVLVPPLVVGVGLGVAEEAPLLARGRAPMLVDVGIVLVGSTNVGVVDCRYILYQPKLLVGNYTPTVRLVDGDVAIAVAVDVEVEVEVVEGEVDVLVGVSLVVGVVEVSEVESEVASGVFELVVAGS